MLAIDPLAMPGDRATVPRLPGVRFAPSPPPLTRVLPRMDIAVFVGFAARGPFDCPVAIEDIDAFGEAFGGEVTLAWDAERGEPIRGQLRAAVRAFFRNGGRRCWVIRVASPGPLAGSPEERPADMGPFLDQALATTPAARLMAEADFIRYEREPSRCLRGIHAALAIDEASLIVVPDAAGPRWVRRDIEVPPDVAESAAPAPEVETFVACDPGPPPPPVVRIRPTADPRTFDVVWDAVDGATSYDVEIAREPGSRRSPITIASSAPVHHVAGAKPGAHRFRVRAVGGRGTSAWSDPVRAVVDLTPTYQVVAPDDRSTALAVHAALLRMCAARGDLFAILSLPESTRPDSALEHVREIQAAITGAGADNGSALVPSTEDDPLHVLSFGALYHPWVLTADAMENGVEPRGPVTGPTDAGRTGGTRSAATARPPDGAIAGVFADRAERRGAWIAPGNVPLRDVVGLNQPIRDGQLLGLYEGQVNAVRATPRGFRALATHTLSLDPTLRPINVRRLLTLLRRLALLHGVDYVFEPNDDAFWRRIQRGFEVLLAGLFERGAFAGNRADRAFRVAVGDPPNSRQSLDAGRLIVELKVAPSVPLEFLTVRLVRSGEQLAFEVA